MKARLIGPLLMVCLGAALLGGAVLPDPVDVGIVTTTTDPCEPMLGAANPCATTTLPETTTTLDPCVTEAVLVVDPCEETTTTEPTSEPTTTQGGGEPTTTAGGGVLPGGEEVDPTTPAAPAPAVAGGELARTGSNDGPLAAAGITLILAGVVLAVLGRRHQLSAHR